MAADPPDPVTPERWRLCTVHPGYLVSDRGRVRRIGGRILKPYPNSRGYLQIRLGGRHARKHYVHRLVLAAFVRPPHGDEHGDHLDFDRRNNAVTNLRWLHAVENSVRWAARTSDGRNVWETPDDVPDDHQPLTDQERAEFEETAAAWS